MSRSRRAPAAPVSVSAVVFALLLLAVGFVSSGCGSSRPVTTTAFEVPMDASGVQHVKLATHSYYFEPNRISVRAGHPVEIEIHNHSFFVPHNFTIAEEGMSVSQGVGMLKGSHTIRFTPDRPGEYEFFCHVGSHAKKGMKGVIVVTP